MSHAIDTLTLFADAHPLLFVGSVCVMFLAVSLLPTLVRGR